MKIVSGDPRLIVDETPGGGYSIRFLSDEYITAKITGNFTISSTKFYTWVEVRPLKNGNGFEVPTGAKAGTSTDNYAIEMNKSATVPTDTFVRLRPRGIADTSLLSGSGCVVNLWEFDYSAATTGTTTTCSVLTLDYVSAISCVDGTITPVYTTICIPCAYYCTTTTTSTTSSTTTTTTSTAAPTTTSTTSTGGG